MLKVVAINSSNRKKNTYNLIAQAKEIFKNNNIEVEIINLFDYDIKTCIGCEHCITKGGCILKDNSFEIMEKMKFSDGIILTTPVYLENVSGKLKTFIDRTCSWFHRPELYGKPVLLMSTTMGSGLKSTLNYLERVVIQWGGFNAGKISRNIRTMNNVVTEDECASFIKHLTMGKDKYEPSLQSLINFQVQKVLAYKLIDLDSEYWKMKNWNNSIYYFDCKINIFNRLIATNFGSFLNNKVNKPHTKNQKSE